MSTELARQFSSAEIDTIKTAIAPKDITTEELQLFIGTCSRTGLDPFSRQIYVTLNKWTDKRGAEQRKINIQATVDGFRVIAERSGKYAGQQGPFWCGSDGVWTDVWLGKEAPAACKVGVVRSDFKDPLWAVAKIESYRQSYSPVWDKMPEQMLAKCAESLALRKAFPNDLSGIYSQDEMAQSETKEAQELVPVVKQIINHAPGAEPRSVASVKKQDAFTNQNVAENLYQELSTWKVPFGKKYIGMTLLDLGLHNSKSYLEWLNNMAKQSGKPLEGGAAKFADMVYMYECYIQEVEAQKDLKSIVEQSTDPVDDIPF